MDGVQCATTTYQSIDYCVGETAYRFLQGLNRFTEIVTEDYMFEFLMLMLLSVVAGVIWMTARRFLGRK